MAATGQGAPGGAPAGPAGVPAPGAPGAPGAPAPQAAPAAEDPWGFGAAAASAPEHLRPMLQAEFDRLSPQLTERQQRYAPVDPFMDRLGPLLEKGEDGGSMLEGLLEFYDMTGDEGRLDDFAAWWDKVGEEYGFYDDADTGDQGAGDDPQLTPEQQEIADLKTQLGELTGKFSANEQQTKVNAAAEQIRTELTSLMQAAGVDGHDDLQSPNAQDVLRLAHGYGEDPEAISKAVADYCRMTGRAQSGLVQGAGGQEVTGLEALQAALGNGGNGRPAPGPALGRGTPSQRPEPVTGWADAKDLAMQRMRES